MLVKLLLVLLVLLLMLLSIFYRANWNNDSRLRSSCRDLHGRDGSCRQRHKLWLLLLLLLLKRLETLNSDGSDVPNELTRCRRGQHGLAVSRLDEDSLRGRARRGHEPRLRGHGERRVGQKLRRR